MTYIPHTEEDIKRMLSVIGVDSLGRLFEDIPDQLLLKNPLNIPPSLSEPELMKKLEALAAKNAVLPLENNFLGAGANRHYISVVVDHILNRSEFYTAYTPYQPEISQGTLQTIFEFQSLICFLTGMEAANASMYDGSSATAEAALMALRITRRKKILVSDALHPLYQSVLRTYVKHQNATLEMVSIDETGGNSFSQVEQMLDKKTAAVIVQYPNFFGIVEDLAPLSELVHQHRSLLIAVVTEPVALGLLTPPGAMDADIVVGEGQSFGIPLQYGGPYVGFMATRQKYIRQMPGRIVGETVDIEGRRGFVLTLSTREQHIRREKATSNICTNQGLCALAATIAMSLLGKTGLRKLAEINLAKAEYAKTRLLSQDHITLPLTGPTFNEFVIETPHDAEFLIDQLREAHFAGGLALQRFYPHMNRRLLLSVTEVNSRLEIDRLAETISGV